VERLFSLPRRDLHPLEAPGLAWRAEEVRYIDIDDPSALHLDRGGA
jgi:hypothetical protein